MNHAQSSLNHYPCGYKNAPFCIPTGIGLNIMTFKHYFRSPHLAKILIVEDVTEHPK